ncbi:MAG: 3-phosphoshikimate 1-carboxyvinyltransferase [Chloroflexi bacterium]|nr:3-phosphoshikimate 1-carboxyvinyltransferase [Chloroflexota bacterium]
MQKSITRPSSLKGEVVLPGDKSLSHRAAIFNSLAVGRATVTNFATGADCRSTLSCLKALGVALDYSPHPSPTVNIEGRGGSGLREPEDVLDAGNSGTTTRLLTGLLAAQPFLSVITGDSSLRSRPMARIIKPLELMGAHIQGRKNNTLAPLAIRGGDLHGIDYLLPVASAQLKSSLVLAAIFASGPTRLEEPALSRDHTERLLSAMGARIERDGNRLNVFPIEKELMPCSLAVPGDISSAAFWLVAGAIHPGAELKVLNCGVNPTRTGILDILSAMGARLTIVNERSEGGEPVADIIVRSSRLKAARIEGPLIPRSIDEIPVLAVAACCAEGDTVIKDAAELRVKESDRIDTTARELTRLGARIDTLPDGMIIHGPCAFTGATVTGHGDHRLAMTLAVAGIVAAGTTIIKNAQAVDISYPTFWRDLEAVCR